MLEAEDALLNAVALLRFRATIEGWPENDALVNTVALLTFTATDEG